MKVSVLQENLAQGLAMVTRAVRNSEECVLLTSSAEGLTLECNSYELGIRVMTAANVLREGRAALPARRLAEYVGQLPAGDVEVELGNAGAMSVRAGRNQATFKALDADGFEVVATVASLAGGWRLRMDTEVWRQAVDRSAFAAARKGSRPVLQGVLVQFRPEGLTMAAADGYQLAVARGAGVGVDLPDLIVPAQVLTEMRNVVDGAESMDLVVDDARTQMVIQAGPLTVAGQLMDGNFPDYAALIPGSHKTRVVANTADLTHGLRVASFFVRQAGRLVALSARRDLLALGGVSSETDVRIEMDAETEGPDLDIVFNVEYLAKALGPVGTERVALEMTAADRAAVVRPVGDEGHLVVQMPVLQNQ